MSERKKPLWDLHETPDGYLPVSETAFRRKMLEWEKRDWSAWLGHALTFPFPAIRIDDSYDAFFREDLQEQPFRLDHEMEVTGLLDEDPDYGVLVSVREGAAESDVPLADLEVHSEEDTNYWPVREYVLWFANREGF